MPRHVPLRTSLKALATAAIALLSTAPGRGATVPVVSGEIVLYASNAVIVGTAWSPVPDASAAGGARLQSTNAGAAKVTTAVAFPASYAELTFTAVAGTPYRLWLRGRAQNDYWGNDSVHVQFSGAVDASGAAIYRIGTTNSAVVNLEDGVGAGLSGWGWQDNGYGVGVLGPEIYFATSGPHTLRIQVREDGFAIDQVVLSSARYLTSAPGALKDDTVILAASGGSGGGPANAAPSVTLTAPAAGSTFTAPATIGLAASASDTDGTVAEVRFYAGTTLIDTDATAPYAASWAGVPAGSYALTAVATDDDGATTTSAAVTVTVDPATGGVGDSSEIVLYALDATRVGTHWSVVSDPSAAGGARLQSTDLGAAKVVTALASPASYAELTFTAEAGKPYRLWLRGKAHNDYWGNDSVHVQFSGAVNASGAPVYRIGTTGAAVVNLEDGSGAGLSGWGWQDNGYGVGVLGPEIYFAATGEQTLRIQVREDGFGIDQVVLSAARYLTGAPGALKNDTTILGTSGGPAPSPVTIVHAPYLQQVTDTSAVIVWSTRENGTAKVEYADGRGTAAVTAATTLLPASRTGMGDVYQHVARLTGLSASTTYAYDVALNGVDPIAGSAGFETAPAPGTGTVTFIAFGDSGTGSTAQQQLAARMSADTFDLALHAGDLAYGSAAGLGAATHTTTTDWFFAVYAGWVSKAATFPSMGNHDSRSANSDGRPYRDLFVLPEVGGSGVYPDHAERYYSFDYGPVHFVVLDTELAFQDASRRAEQISWLEADLAASSAPWKVAYFHRSPFSAGGEHGSDLAVRAAFAPLFERYGVQLAISAHEHVYERSKPWMTGTTGTPVTYLVTGGGGGPLYSAGSAEWTAVSGSFHHYLKATAGTCTLTVDAVTAAGATADSVTLTRCGS